MKKILFVLSMLISVAYGQSIGYFRYDTVVISKSGGNAEFKLLNATRNVTGGVLTNVGGGRTAFVTPTGGGGEDLLATALLGNSADSILFRQVSNHGFANSISGFGDSFTNPGSNASTDSSYIDRLAAYYSLTLSNYGAASRGVYVAIENHNANIFPGHSTITSMMAAFNDLRRTDTTAALTYRKTKNKIINAHKSMFANHFLKLYYEAGSGNVTRYGSWSTGYNPNTVGGKSGSGAYTQSANDSLVYSFTGQNNVVAGLIGADSVNQAYARGRAILYEPSTGTVIKDTTFTENNQWDGISDGSNNNQRGPMCLIFYDLSKTKTYKLKLISTQSTNVFAVDYVGHLVDPASGMIMVVFDPAYMDATGYGTSPAGASDRVMDEGKRVIDSTINDIKRTFPAYIANTNSQYVATTSSGLSGDHIHPNNTGHRQIFQTATAVLPVPTYLPREGSIVHIGSNVYMVLDGALQQLNGYINASTGIHEINTGTSRTWSVYLSEGKAGGQSAYGGLNSGDNLTLNSTIHATKGSVLIDGSAAFEGVNKRVAIGGTTTSDAHLYIAHAGINNSDRILKMKKSASQTGDMITMLDNSNNIIARWFASGAVGFGSGIFDGNYPFPGTYICRQSSTQVIRNYNGTTWEPTDFEASTLNIKTGASSNASAVFINGSQQVGIGTGAPTEVLTVNGQIRINAISNVGTNDSILYIEDGKIKAGLNTVTSGTYTPTLTSVANISATTAYVCQYIRVGSVVTVSGMLEMNVTAGGPLNTEVGISLPIASALASDQQAGGVGSSQSNTEAYAIFADPANDRARIQTAPAGTGNRVVHFSFTYQIL